jgi:enediyne biosynthesis protein E4
MKKFNFCVFLCVFIFLACDDSSSSENNNNNNNNNQNFPPARCQESPNSNVVFEDVSEEVKIDASNLHVLGNRLGAVDLNNDGYPDILVHKVAGAKRDAENALDYERGKRILLNVPDEIDPSKRVYKEFTLESGYDTIVGTNTRGRGASFAVAGDFNNDGNVDLLSVVNFSDEEPDVLDRTVVLLGDGSGFFTPVEGSQPFDQDNFYGATGASLLDYDKDSKLDIFIGYAYTHYGVSPQQDRLFRNFSNGFFIDTTGDTNITTGGDRADNMNPKATFGTTICDINSDGWPDLLTSSYGRAFNNLWLNSNGNDFSEHGESSGYWADENTNYFDHQYYVYHCEQYPGAECTDVVPGEQKITCDFTYDPWNVGYDDQPHRNAGTTFTTLCADFNNDGFMDVYHAEIRHWHHGDSSDPSQMLLNSGSATGLVFERPGNEALGLDRPHTIADWNEGDLTAVVFDFNNDGLLDIFVGDSDYPKTKGRLFKQLSDHTFNDVADSLGVDTPRATGVTYLDYDQDGDYDLLIGFSRMRCSASDTDCPYTEPVVRLFRNNGGSKSNRVVFRLSGDGYSSKSNSLAIGAVMKITTTDAQTSETIIQTRELQSGYGHSGIQTPLEISFGLGNNCIMEKVEIIWPGFTQPTVYENLSGNYIYFIDETDGITSWNELPVNE